jgi:hypothetical protein
MVPMGRGRNGESVALVAADTGGTAGRGAGGDQEVAVVVQDRPNRQAVPYGTSPWWRRRSEAPPGAGPVVTRAAGKSRAKTPELEPS